MSTIPPPETLFLYRLTQKMFPCKGTINSITFGKESLVLNAAPRICL